MSVKIPVTEIDFNDDQYDIDELSNIVDGIRESIGGIDTTKLFFSSVTIRELKRLRFNFKLDESSLYFQYASATSRQESEKITLDRARLAGQLEVLDYLLAAHRDNSNTSHTTSEEDSNEKL